MTNSKILNVKVLCNKSESKVIIDESSDRIIVHLKLKPIKGKANLGLIKIISKYLKIPQNSIEIISGAKSKNKLIKITTDDQRYFTKT